MSSDGKALVPGPTGPGRRAVHVKRGGVRNEYPAAVATRKPDDGN